MEDDQDYNSRKASLQRELNGIIDKHKRLHIGNYLFSYFIAIMALFTSASAAIGGVFLDWDGKFVGAIAVVPGALTLLANVLKPQIKANWHFKRIRQARSLRRELEISLPPQPTVKDIANIGIKLNLVDDEMAKEWEAISQIDWALIRNFQRET